MSLSELDALLAEGELPVRPETLAGAWDVTPAHDRTALPAAEVLVLVTMRARAGAEGRLEDAAQEFVRATSRLPGALGSTLHRSRADPPTFYLIERFSGEDSFGAHMASDYFRRFQVAQEGLLAEPVQALFLQR
jgi:quinol monooxygenase YgiN